MTKKHGAEQAKMVLTARKGLLRVIFEPPIRNRKFNDATDVNIFDFKADGKHLERVDYEASNYGINHDGAIEQFVASQNVIAANLGRVIVNEIPEKAILDFPSKRVRI